MNVSIDPLRDIPIIEKYLGRLIEISTSVAKERSFLQDDTYALIINIFLSKQIDHAECVKMLVKNNFDRDAAFISRAMMEGAAKLIWISKEPEKRSEIWRAFGYVSEYITMLEMKAYGDDTNLLRSEQIKSNVDLYGHPFLKKKYRDGSLAPSKLPANAFYDTWTVESGKKFSVMELLLNVKLDISKELYRELSRWGHWSHRGFIDAVEYSDARVQYVRESKRTGAMASAAAFEALLDMNYIYFNKFEEDDVGRLVELKDRYLGEMKR